jgi:iron(III) transport system permease protein
VLLALVASAIPLLWLDSVGWRLAGNTLLLAVATVGLALPPGIVLAWLLVRTDLPGRRFWLAALGVQVLVPMYLHAAAWQAALGITGWFTRLSDPPWVLLTTWRGAIWVHVVTSIPWVVLLVGAGLRYVEPALEEEALLSGGMCRVIRRVSLPRAALLVAAAALWVALLAATEISATDLFRVRTHAEELYAWLSFTNVEPVERLQAVAAGVTLSVWITLLLALCAAAALPVVSSMPPRAVRTMSLGRAGWLWGAGVALLLGLWVGVPLASLVYKAGLVPSGPPPRAWSPAAFVQVLWRSLLDGRSAIGWSLWTASLAATAALVLGVWLTWRARRSSWASLTALGTGSVAMAVPGPLLALGILCLLDRRDLPWVAFLADRTVFPTWLALTVRGLPLVLALMWIAWRSIPQTQLDAATLEGAGTIARFWKVAVPQRRGMLLAAWLVAWAIAMADLGASSILETPGAEMLSKKIFRLLHASLDYEVAGLCLAFLGLLLLAAAAAYVAVVRQANRRG